MRPVRQTDQLCRAAPNGGCGLPKLATLLAMAIVVGGVLVAGCGGGSNSANVATVSSPDTSGSSGASSGSTPPGALAFARCMRANGVADFPDPSAGGGLAFHASASVISSPAFRAARAKCGKLIPTPGGPGGGTVPPQVEAHALVQLRTVALCMRQHGISDFPDPSTTPPPNPSPGEYTEITDYEGVFLLFPATIDMQSPAWEQAAAACGTLAESFNHPHH